MKHLAYHVVRTIETNPRVCPQFRLKCLSFGFFNNAVRSNAKHSISRHDVEDSVIAAPGISSKCRHIISEILNAPGRKKSPEKTGAWPDFQEKHLFAHA